MSESTLTEAAALTRELGREVAEARGDLGRMPFFVRPMVKRGFRKRTGKTMQEWESLCAAVAGELEAGDAAAVKRRRLVPDLERLRENFRTAPERAERGMGSDAAAMAAVRERSSRREKLAGDLIAALSAL